MLPQPGQMRIDQHRQEATILPLPVPAKVLPRLEAIATTLLQHAHPKVHHHHEAIVATLLQAAPAKVPVLQEAAVRQDRDHQVQAQDIAGNRFS